MEKLSVFTLHLILLIAAFNSYAVMFLSNDKQGHENGPCAPTELTAMFDADDSILRIPSDRTTADPRTIKSPIQLLGELVLPEDLQLDSAMCSKDSGHIDTTHGASDDEHCLSLVRDIHRLHTDLVCDLIELIIGL